MASYEHIYFHDKDYICKISLLRIEGSYSDNYVTAKRHTFLGILFFTC